MQESRTQPTTDTVLVTGHRFTLDGLTVTGGRNAVVIPGASRATLRNCGVRGTGGGVVGGIGIVFFQGASGSVDHCDASGNPADGMMLDASNATITNSTFSANAGPVCWSSTAATRGSASRAPSRWRPMRSPATDRPASTSRSPRRR